MDAPRWQKIKQVLDGALSLSGDERHRFIQDECETEEDRREVLSLLSSFEEQPDFLERAVAGEAMAAVRKHGASGVEGKSVGRYRILREIGRGGMGTVYLAERADGAYRQEVAVKLVSEGRMLTSIADRLRQERQILARLQHPGIARLLDGGVTDDGYPYLVMEYVAGESVTDYCNSRSLGVTERLNLFGQVCDAVHYAHQNLVIHRDLKPSNILVAESGEVKLLDFGIAKILDDTDLADLTRTGNKAMTPAYASPEQVRGEVVSTASDIYSLGVILYEMLTGERPYGLAGLPPTEVERTVCEIRPPKPSTRTSSDKRRRRLEGDLDTITMMALRKEPQRRYESVAEFAADVQRHLDRQPVIARPATVRYLAASFVRRNYVGVGAAVLVVLALVAGIVSTAVQAGIASSERDRARERSEQLHELARTMLGDLHATIRDLPGTTSARRTLVSQATKYLELLADEVATDSLQTELAESLVQLGEIRGDPHFPNLGDIKAATANYEEAYAIRHEKWSHDTTSVVTTHALARTLGRLAVVNSWGGDNKLAIRRSRRALELLERLESTPQVRRDHMRIESELGWWHVWAGETQAALELLASAETTADQLTSEGTSDVDFMIDYWRIFAYRSDALQFEGNVEGALQTLVNRGAEISRRVSAAHPINPRATGISQTNQIKIARLYALDKRYDRALEVYRQQLVSTREAARLDTMDMRLPASVGGILHAMGDVHTAMGNRREALRYYVDALDIRRRIFQTDTTNGENGYVVASSLRELCDLHLEDGKLDEARALCTESTEVQHSVVESDPYNLVGQEALKNSYVLTARVEVARAQQASGVEEQRELIAEALQWYDRTLALLDTLRVRGANHMWVADPSELEAERAEVAALYE